MILETTYNYKEIREEISDAVGKPIPFFKRLRMGGNGSQRLVIVEAFEELEHLISVDNKSKFCNIEIREKGIIVHFRSRLESYAWVVPFYLLSIFKSDNSFSIFSGVEFVRLKAAHNSVLNQKFIKKILDCKAERSKTEHHISQL